MELLNRSGFAPAWLVWKIRPPIWSLTVIAKGTFDLVAGGPATPSETQFPATGDVHVEEDPERALVYGSDFAPIKPRTDLLLVGTCRPPRPVDTCGVTFALGKWSKKLAVTSKEPFDRAPLTYERALRSRFNPIGSERPGVVHIGAPPGDDPAGFGPIPQTWPQRRSKMKGSYGKDWLKTRWPWWPEEFDWGYYNAAPADQQVNGVAGDEELFLENLVPKSAAFRGRLPGVRARAFVKDASGFPEIPLAIDTVWVDAEQGKLVVVWRGTRDVKSETLREIGHLCLFSEPLAGPSRSREECLRELEVPGEIPPPEPAPAPGVEEPPAARSVPADVIRAESQLAEVEQTTAQYEARAMEALRKAGVAIPKTPPKFSAAAIQKKILDALAQAKQAMLSAGKPVPPGLEHTIQNPPTIPDLGEIEPPKPAAAPEPPAEPPPPTRESVLAEGGNLAGRDLTGIDLSGADLAGANLQGAILKGANLSKADLSGADLSGAVLANANFEKAGLRSAILRAADLGEARLDGADLSDAKMEEATFIRASVRDARMGMADATDSDFSGADLTGSDLRKARFARAMLPDSKLDGVDLSGANLSGANLARASGTGLRAEGADLTAVKAAGARFEGARFRKVLADRSIWEGASLKGADFSFAQLRGAEFSSADLEGAKLISANAREGRFVEAKLRAADATRANLFRGSLEKADLAGACFAEANLFEAETWEAVLDRADLRGANVLRSKLAMKE